MALGLRINRWALFFYVAHVFGCISAVCLVLVAFFTNKIEKDTVGAFNLKLTHTIMVVFCVAAGFLLLTVVIGFLAQRLADKPSLWILYCILLSIFSLCVLIVSVSAMSKSKTRSATAQQLKISMEFYVKDTENGTRWDNLHKKYKCCGVESYKDWQDVHFGRTSLRVPMTCCKPPKNDDEYCGLNLLPHDDKADEKIYSRGCMTPAFSQLKIILNILGLMGLTISLIHMILAALACYLVTTKRV